MAFTQNTQATRVKQPRRAGIVIVSADGTAAKTVDTAGPNGSKYVSLIAISSDTTARLINILAGGFFIGAVPIPAQAGWNGSISVVNLLDPALIPLPLDSDGNPYFFLNPTDTLTVELQIALSAGQFIHVSALAIGDF
jgi:hypothetical protein